MLLLQCTLVFDVLVDWELPWIVDDPHAMSGEALLNSIIVHSVAMRFSVSRFVVDMMSLYGIFGFTAVQWLDNQSLKEPLSECVRPSAGFYDEGASVSLPGRQRSHQAAGRRPGAIGITCSAPSRVSGSRGA